MPDATINTFCRSHGGEWRRVLAHSDAGVDVAERAMAFNEAWEAGPPSRSESELPIRLRWQDLVVPLPSLRGSARAWALTYPEHQKEVHSDDAFDFEKRGDAESTWAPIRYRPALDYEAELAILLHRDEPGRFGFLFANDFTDRSAQVLAYDRRRPAPGFSAAKSFPGALRVGPLLAVGAANSWVELEVRLEVNGQMRQHVRARECLLTPPQFHKHAFDRPEVHDWVLVLTGTTGGTIFHAPSSSQRLKLLFKNGFSARRAKQEWLDTFQFLRAGDRLSMQSEILGRSHATIVEGTE